MARKAKDNVLIVALDYLFYAPSENKTKYSLSPKWLRNFPHEQQFLK
jgi:hypothetical protein